ncbi:MAG: response regulator transcription factor [Nitriliruptorales bacterium]
MTCRPVPRVLVVEDEPRIAGFLVKGLQREGYDVVAAEDGDVATFLVDTEEFDALLLDLGLPGTSGLGVLHAVRRRNSRVPVLILSAHDDPATREQCLQAGATSFLAKPLVFAEVVSALHAQLREAT